MSYESVPRWLREIIEAVKKYPWLIGHVPDNLKTQNMYNEAVEFNPSSL